MEMSDFALNVMEHKYSHDLEDGEKETWDNIAYRVTKNVMKAAGYNMRTKTCRDLYKAILERKFIPGGRYLNASGRPYHQTQNCLLLRADDSREGWSELLYKSAMSLMTGAGIGIEYSRIREEGARIRRTGGVATGPLALMQMVNECARWIMQGGSRRSAIWAGLNWQHPDVHKFVTIKDWSDEVKAMKEKDFNFPATLDMTNISIGLDDEFFEAYHDKDNPQHSLAHGVYWTTVRHMLRHGEPGFSVNCGSASGEDLRNAPVSAGTQVLTKTGYKTVGEIVGIPTQLWTGKQWAEATFVRTKVDTPTVKVSFTGGREIVCDPTHEFFVKEYTGRGKQRKCDIVKVTARDLKQGDYLEVSLPSVEPVELDKVSYTAGFMFGDGSEKEVTLCTPEKKALRPYLVGLRQGNCGRGYDRFYCEHAVKDHIPEVDCVQSFLAGWFDADGSYDEDSKMIRLSGEYQFIVEARRLLESIGILSTVSKTVKSGYGGEKDIRNLVVLRGSNTTFSNVVPCQRLNIPEHKAYRKSELVVQSVTEDVNQDVYCCDVQVPEHSFMAEGVIISNCTEVVSADDSEICNLGSINLANVESLEEMDRLVELGTKFLLAGTLYSDVPYPQVDKVRSENRRLGLGVMGVHEWLLKKGKIYGPDEELEKYLDVYGKSNDYAQQFAERWDISVPIATRAIAPTGTIGIVAETTTGIEPIFCVAYKRRYLKGSVWCYQYVLDPCAKRLIDSGIHPGGIEDAYRLAETPERRVAFQTWIQKWVDQGISSTINLPAWGTELNNESLEQDFGNMLIKHLPDIRGITVYPDGSRGGQPLTPVPYTQAIGQEGIELVEEQVDICEITKGGSCGA